jgi:bifunctional UDP-N-acetylglucosamine pyrophosphorylase / glucosamine-1-phosphate N-acetyltransferase
LSVIVVIPAAGLGTRMKSNMPKLLHEVGGKAMIIRDIETAEKIGVSRPVVVVGHDSETLRAAVGERAQFVVQAQQRGTGHAVLQASALLKGQAEIVVVFNADLPLLRAETLLRLVERQQANQGPITLLTAVAPDPRGFGRIIRAKSGDVMGIIEEQECTPAQRLITEYNVGAYAFASSWLWDNLPGLSPKANGEYYLTDTVELAVKQGWPVLGVSTDDQDEIIGVNTRIHLSEAESALRKRIAQHWMLEGITLLDPATTYIHEDATLGTDTLIYPNTHIWGHSKIGAGCILGPNTVIRDSQIGAGCTVNSSVVEEATLENDVEIGPFAHLRAGAYLSAHVHMGNFGEIKNSRLGPGTRMGHFSYIGDAEIGEEVNIGAGTVTANFDGVRKHKTIIGAHALIGSDTMLVAPVTVGMNAQTAAGAVVTRDVPEGQIAVGVPARSRPFTSANKGLAKEPNK